MQKLMFFIILMFFVVSGCQSDSNESVSAAPKSPYNYNKQIEPLILPENTFYKVVDWLDEQSFLFIKREGSKASIQAYDLLTGNVNKLYSIEGIIVNAALSPSKRSLLVHQAVDKDTAKILLMDMQSRNITWEKEIDSYELTFTWNPFKESQILFTAFEENWDYKVWLADSSQNTWKEIENLTPFYKWKTKNSVFYQKWETDSTASTSALMEFFIHEEKEEHIDGKLLTFDFQDPFILSVYVNDETSTYQYKIDQPAKEAVRFVTPGHKLFSDWVVPQHEFIVSTKELVMFRLDSKGVSEIEEKTFSMILIDLSTGKEKTIQQFADNAPLSCSPGGTYCLTGQKLSNVVNLDTGESNKLIIMEEEIE
ncbi:YqgU-like beta propeller domain-containing protein [Jeotgalibacillus campisalis]|uniref:YqgU-like 6-bladed beta-propeller domain-containing protein n=1 Tax=Jeotgalibacillus campisalis TaxID=220754 RepID=A0A0C2VAL8_9BACL|nr:hypothetical protein [Jeotgalibacillus campisalis]KIL45987.1 hypothetical protein KR50_26620 [Jeotgalibacillus campisalis]